MNARPQPFIAPQTLLDETGVQGVYVPLHERPIYFNVGVGADRYGARYVTTFMFDDAKGKQPIGWTRGEKVAGDVWKDGRGHHRTLIPMPVRGLIDMEDGETSCASYSVEGR